MAKKQILSVGFGLASDDVKFYPFDSDVSLLDWDIVLFRPIISDFLTDAGIYKGKHALRDGTSAWLKERSDHWRREIKDAVENGKTVIVFLAELEDIYVDSGKRKYSGTGRNQKITTIVEGYSNYKSIPLDISPISTKGSAIKLSPKGSEIIVAYWKEFEGYSQYKVTLSGEGIPDCLLTKNGDKPVGAIYRIKDSFGTLLLLPDIEFYADDFLEDNEGEQVWTEEAAKFAARMVKAVVSLDRALKSDGEVTPEPTWATASEYELESEKESLIKLLELEEQLEQVQAKKESLFDDLKNSRRLRNLLFEKGKLLEHSILDGLKTLGFKAAPYKDSESEFDVVFESVEGRLIGEAEGKDNNAINIDKLRQLTMNIHEDLRRDDVDLPAKGILFGNAYRLLPLKERPAPFTDKCVSAAKLSSVALLFTPDLFRVTQYLSNNDDGDFATSCRLAIINAVGMVKFPDIPQTERTEKKIDHLK